MKISQVMQVLNEMQAGGIIGDYAQTGRAKDKLRLNQFVEEGAMDPARFLDIVRRHNLEPAWIKFQQQLEHGAS